MIPVSNQLEVNCVIMKGQTKHSNFSFFNNILSLKAIQARIAQLVAYWLGTGKVPGSNPGKGENFSLKLSNWIVQI